MNDPIETIPSPPASGKNDLASWAEIWKTLLTNPNEAVYAQIAATGKATTAYLWIFIGISFGMLVSFVLGSFTSENMQEAIGMGLLGLLCMAPFFGALITLFAALNVALVQWGARLFGGEGNYEQLMYLYGGIHGPLSAISGLFAIIPLFGGLASSVLSLYGFYLSIVAVKAVNRFGTGKAIAAIFIPILLFTLLAVCCFVIVAMLMGPTIDEIFRSLQTMP